jgi:hypothetical protein
VTSEQKPESQWRIGRNINGSYFKNYLRIQFEANGGGSDKKMTKYDLLEIKEERAVAIYGLSSHTYFLYT